MLLAKKIPLFNRSKRLGAKHFANTMRVDTRVCTCSYLDSCTDFHR
uniref:Uncharacterized protein n=1 Tax=Anguilla anguilla TaxID=7936 RepID=A0A0E9VMC7_ANGAN